MIRVGVIGATGYAGAELVRILCAHPEIELTVLSSRQYSGVKFDSVYPSMAGVVDLVCQEFDIDLVCDRADVVFTALPHKLPMSIVPELIDRGKKVVDFSADFRYKDAQIYESFYETHTAKDLLAKAVYGLCEIYFETGDMGALAETAKQLGMVKGQHTGDPHRDALILFWAVSPGSMENPSPDAGTKQILRQMTGKDSL